MVTNMAGIQKGMDVFDTNGEKIGSVADVLQIQAVSETNAASAANDPYADPSSAVAGQGTVLKVNQGGVLGIGATELYIPVSDVSTVVPGENLTINCAKDACAGLYGTKPAFLGDD